MVDLPMLRDAYRAHKSSVFDALRNAKSATETLWVAYLCKLLGDDRASQYYEFALLLDSGEAMRAEVAALRAE